MKNIITILLLLATSTIYAQDCSAYDNLIAEGNTAFSNGDYERAVKRYNLAMLNCPEKITEVQEKILSVFTQIELLKTNAEKQKQIADDERNKTNTALVEIEKQKKELEKQRDKIKSEKEKKQRIIDALHFHEGRFALASQKIHKDSITKYGFIDTLGKETIPYIYDEASSFDANGLAKVIRGEYSYLIDTTGKEYRVTNNPKQLNGDILALDLRDKKINTLTSNVYENIQLKILLFPQNSPIIVSTDIEKLINLEIVDMGASMVSSRFASINNLKSLKARLLQRPKAYFLPKQNTPIGILPKLVSSGGQHDWIVSSDRDNNPLYDAPNNKIPNGKTMNFMDNFYVIGETETYLELIKYDRAVASNNSSRKVDMKNADYYGWAPKDKLLLWRKSLVNPKNRFDINALMVSNPKDVNKGIKQQLHFYNSPALEETYKNKNNNRLSEGFLYVFDRKNDSYLVGLFPEAPRSEDHLKEEMLGWVSSKDIQLWTGRLCLEPNNDPIAAEERRAKGIKATVFSNYQATEEFKSESEVQLDKIIWDEDKYERRYPLSWKRMPVLGQENGIYRTAVISDVFDKNNNIILSADEYAILHTELKEGYDIVRNKKENINLAFVIDGTKDSHVFFDPIIRAIEGNVNLFENTNKKYKIGAFIYGKSGEGIVERQPMTTVHTAVIQTLKNYQNKQDIPADNNDPTDMYEGINTALRTLNPKETNILVLIGDAGNALNASNSNTIRRIKERECSIISFQIRAVGGRAGLIYDKFIDQTEELILASSSVNDIPPKLYEYEGTTQRLRYPEEAIIPGSLTYSDKNGNMNSTQLQEEIKYMLKSFEDQYEALFNYLDCKINANCKPDINDAVQKYISRKFPNIDFEKIRDVHYQLFLEGYAPIQINKLEYPLFKHVLFLSERELYDLRVMLTKLVVGGSSSELRENLIRAYKEMINSHYSTNVANKDNMTLGEIIENLTGMPSNSGLLNKYTLKDLENRRKVSDYEIRDINYYIEDKSLALKKVIGNPDYFFRSRDNTYYWVPQDVIP